MTQHVSDQIIRIVLSGLLVPVIAMTLYMLIYVAIVMLGRPRIGKWATVIAHFAGSVALIITMYIGFQK
ncbi:TPA: hypothetical protein ACK3Q6_007678 [Burkholderia cepacia]